MFIIKGASTIEQYTIMKKWLEENFADESVRAIFTSDTHAEIIDLTGDVLSVEICDGKILDYEAEYLQRLNQQTESVDAASEEYLKQTRELRDGLKKGDFSNMNDKVDALNLSMKQLETELTKRTQLRLEHMNQKEWSRLLRNDNWIPMEKPRQLSTEYFDNPNIKDVTLLYQLDESSRQEIIREPSYAERAEYGMPNKFHLGLVNGRKELILGEDFFDHEMFYYSRDATEEYEISCKTLKEVANHMYAYEDQITLVVDEQHLNHEPGEMVNQADNFSDKTQQMKGVAEMKSKIELYKKYDIVQRTKEISYKNRYDIKAGCTYGEDETTIKSCKQKEEALKELYQNASSIRELSNAGGIYFEVTEYVVEENTYNQEGEFVEGGDELAYSDMKIGLVTKPSYQTVSVHDNFKDAEYASLELDVENYLDFSEGVNKSFDAAIEEALEAAEIPEPEFEMEM